MMEQAIECHTRQQLAIRIKAEKYTKEIATGISTESLISLSSNWSPIKGLTVFSACVLISIPFEVELQTSDTYIRFYYAKMINKLRLLCDSKNRPWESLVMPISGNKIRDFIQQGVHRNFRLRGLNSSKIYFNCSYANVEKKQRK